MQKDKFTDLDLEFREMFLNAEEEVPSRIWDSLSEELDRRSHRKVAALWWRRAAAGVAVAAAVMSGIFLLPDHSTLVQPSVSSAVAEISSTEKAEQDIPDIQEQIAASSPVFIADVRETHRPDVKPYVPSEAVPSEASDMRDDDENDVTVPASDVPSTAGPVSPVPQVSKDTESWTDPFAMLEDEEESPRHGVSLSLSGNVMSNDATGNGTKASRAPVAGNIQTTGITETSISTYGIPLSLGLGAEISLNDRWSVGTGINWTLLSRSFNGIYTEVNDGRLVKSINSDINNEIHYIGIPLNLYYNILTDKNMKFYAWGGGMVEKGISNKYRIHSAPEDIFYKKNVTGMQWSAGLGLGLEFSLNDHLGLFIDPSARYYFDCDQPTSVRTRKPYMLNLEAGLRFNL